MSFFKYLCIKYDLLPLYIFPFIYSPFIIFNFVFAPFLSFFVVKPPSGFLFCFLILISFPLNRPLHLSCDMDAGCLPRGCCEPQVEQEVGWAAWEEAE